MFDTERICLDLCTLECGLILETERDSVTEFVCKAGEFKERRCFNHGMVKHAVKLKTASFYLNKTTVLWFKKNGLQRQ